MLVGTPQMAFKALQVVFQQLSLAWGVGMTQTDFHSRVTCSGLSDQSKLSVSKY